MAFNLDEIRYTDCLKVGSDNAPVKIVEYLSLRCPDARHYVTEVVPHLAEAIGAGQVQRIIKHFDKEKLELEKGNLLNQYLDYQNPEKSLLIIEKLFEDQDDWGSKRLSSMPHVAQQYGLSLEIPNQALARRVYEEGLAVNIDKVPTVFVQDQAFVETFDTDDFLAAVEKAVQDEL